MSEPKVNEESAKLALMELADAFGVDQTPEPGVENALLDWVDNSKVPPEVKKPSLLSVAMEGRLYLEGNKAVYILASPVELADGSKMDVLRFREPETDDYTGYSKGTTLDVHKDGGVTVSPVLVIERTKRTVSALADKPIGLMGRIKKRDIFTLSEVCDALGFFE